MQYAPASTIPREVYGCWGSRCPRRPGGFKEGRAGGGAVEPEDSRAGLSEIYAKNIYSRPGVDTQWLKGSSFLGSIF